MAAAPQIPDVQSVAVFLAQKQFGNQAALEHVRRAPFARNQRVESEVPPEVIGQLLGSPVDLPAAAHVEALAVDDEDTARAAAVRTPEAIDIETVGAAMHRVRAGVAGLVRYLARLDGLDQLGLLWIGFRVEHVDA